MSQYFHPYRSFLSVKVELDLSNYATKTDLQNVAHVDVAHNFELKSDPPCFKTEIDKIDVEKLKTVSVDLSKLSNVVNNDVVKKTVYDKLVTEINNIDTTRFVLKTKHETDKSNLKKKISNAEKKIPNTYVLVKNRL